MDDRTDQELVAAVLKGNADEFGRLVRRYQDAYFTFATRMLGSRDDADDALQSAFIRAFRSLRQCREPDKFGAWLHRIVLNECRTYASRRDRRDRHFEHPINGLDQLPGSVPAVSEDLEEIERAVARLDVDQREAFLLKHVQDLEYEDMSALTGASVSALKMRVKRACERLRELLDRDARVS